MSCIKITVPMTQPWSEMKCLLGYLIFFIVTVHGFKAYFGVKAHFIFYFFAFVYLIVSFLAYYPIRKIYVSQILTKKMHKKKLKYLKEQGFNDSYSTTGVMIDTVKKKIAFTVEKVDEVLMFDFSDIRRWNVQTHTNTIQRSNGTEASRDHYSILVSTNDPANPSMKFHATGFDDANAWISRFNAIING